MKQGYWVIRTYTSGRVGEKIKYWVDGVRPPKSKRRIKQELRKIKQNEASAEKQLARLLNENFKAGDLLLGLDYSTKGYAGIKKRADDNDGPGTQRDKRWNAAAHEVTLCLRRVRRELAKEGIELKQVCVTSDMDGETGELVRLHHHLVLRGEYADGGEITPKEQKRINKMVASAFVDKWQRGGVNWQPLSHQEDYTAVAKYLIRQVRHIPDAKKYTSSRNLIRPEPIDRVATSNAEMRVPTGCRLLHRNEYRPYAPQYMRYYIPPERGSKREIQRE